MAMGADVVNVFAYTDYRRFLHDLYRFKKSHDYGFSHRSFARRAGLRSSNYLKLIIEGSRNLTPTTALRFAHGCGLTKHAADYFCDLVAFNQAKTTRERERAYERLARFREHRALRKLDAEQAAYHSTWYLPAIRELVTRRDFRDDPSWIARTLLPPIRSAQAKKALATLQALGLLCRNEHGQLVQADSLLTTGDGPQGHHIARYHRTMLECAARSIDAVARDERDISAITVCIDDATLQDVRHRIAAFRRELLQYADQSNDRTRVVQINFQMFPLSKGGEE
jgi:uncharacterized protein (TIGR02147 family)